MAAVNESPRHALRRLLPFALALVAGMGLWLMRPAPQLDQSRPSAEAIQEVVRNLYDRRTSRVLALESKRKARGLERALRNSQRIAHHTKISVSEAQATDPSGTEKIDTPFTCLARTLYWEAKGEGTDGMEAVAVVVLNRLRRPGFPETICAVVQEDAAATCQFSWWCDGRSDDISEPAAYAVAKEITRRALNGDLRDTTGGALYYHARSVDPFWAASYENTAQIGNHIFYKPEGDRDR